MIRIAKCHWLEDEIDPGAGPSTRTLDSSFSSQAGVQKSGNPVSKLHNDISQQPSGLSASKETPNNDSSSYERPINYSDEFRSEFDEPASESSSDLEDFIDVDNLATEDDLYEDLDEGCPKYLIFSTGSRTYTPHQIGIKKVGKVNFPRKLEPGPTIQERIALRERRRQLERLIDSLSPEEARLQIANRFDTIDELIELEGHIIGLCLSPDNRFLYVNSRPWPSNCVITNPLDPPPISQEIDIHVIDLQTFKKVGTMLRAHKAYTPNTECFFIFLNVSENFVASGSEDFNAYCWDSKL